MSSSNLSVPPSLSPSPSSALVPKPTQVKFYRAAQMALFAHIAVFPPLGQVTVAAPSRDPVSLYFPLCTQIVHNFTHALYPIVVIYPTIRGASPTILALMPPCHVVT